MNNSLEISKKLQRAENLRKPSNYFLKWFSSSDFVESASIFEEIADADAVTDRQEKEKYLLEAANTFVLENKEYNLFRASETYKKLSDLFRSSRDDASRFIEYSLKQIYYLEQINKYSISGQKLIELGEVFESEMAIKNEKADELAKTCDIGPIDSVSIDHFLHLPLSSKALACYSKAVSAFAKVSGYKNNLLNARNKVLSIQILRKDLKGIYDSLSSMKFECSQLCSTLLSILLNIDRDIDDLEKKSESVFVNRIINSEGPECQKIIEEFRTDNVVNNITNQIIDLFFEKYIEEGENC